ncbi:MAG: sugar phosphate isomerase/epimerase [Victivallaceae bacterium]
MFFSGFADEAACDVDGQIVATLTLGWNNLEWRSVDGVNVCDLDDAAFENALEAFCDNGIRISCFGSTIANWGVSPFNDEEFEQTKIKLSRTLRRMKQANCNLLRGMSFMMQRNLPPDDPDWEKQVFTKVRTLVEMCADCGVIYGHENCMNYGGQSYKHTLKLLKNVNMDNLKLIYDTGNPVFTDFRVGAEPYQKQSSWEFYQQVKDFITYVHIKDGHFLRESAGIFPEVDYTMPGAGEGDVKRIVTDLLGRGYDGGFSIEPHMTRVFHQADETNPPDDIAPMLEYLRYGVKFMKLFDEAKAALKK